MKKLVLIDGHSILNRAFYGVPELTNSEGLHTNAVYGFLNIMFKILDEEKPDYLMVAFDLSAPTFRHKMFAEYKGTRKPMAPELREQVPLIKEALNAMNITVVTKEGFEADDILGTMAKKAEKSGVIVSVVSGDRDLLQLATDNIKIRIPKTKKGVTEIEDYNTKEVVESYGVTPLEFIDMKALMGDASDNIPGVPGIGEKTAGNIIAKFHSIENAHEHAQEITPNKARTNLVEFYEQAVMSKVLATINVEVPFDKTYDEMISSSTIENMFSKEAYELFKRLEFKSILNRFDKEDTLSDDTIEDSFVVIDDFNEAEKIFASAQNEKNIGIHIAFEKKNSLTPAEFFGVSICFNDEKVYYIPKECMWTEDYLSGKIVALVNEAKNTDKHICFINLKEQLKAVSFDENKNVDDIALMSYLINPLKDSYFYDDVARDFLGKSFKSQAELIGKKQLKDLDREDRNMLVKLTCYNAYVNYKARNILYDKLISLSMDEIYRNIELPLVYVLKEMEDNGIRVDKEALVRFGDMLKGKLVTLEKEIYELAGEEFNINSPKQLGVILFEKLGLKGGKKTKTGYSTSADVLEKLADDNELVGKILEYRQLTKLNSTYADGLIPYISEDGRIHGTFNQTITATGRISSTEPNLQNIPIRMELGSKVREVFIPRDGFVFLDSDYSQIELRILAHMSKDERLIEAYNSDEDIHRITASQVFNTPLEEVTKTQRSNAKAVNFGIVYGISSFGLSQDLSISKKEAAQYIEKYFVTYPKVKAFLDELVDSARKNGYSVTMYGRRRPLPEINSSNFMQKQFGERVAMNAPIQGTAADIIKLAMIGVHRALKENMLKSKLILQVHDELLVETAIDEIEAVKAIIENEMKNAAKLSVSLVVDTNQGNNWLEAH